MGMFDFVGPVLAIVVIYGVYKIFGDLDTAQKEKEVATDISKIQVEIERDRIKLEREKLFLEYRDRHGDQQLPFKGTEVEYKVLEDKRKDKK